MLVNRLDHIFPKSIFANVNVIKSGVIVLESPLYVFLSFNYKSVYYIQNYLVSPIFMASEFEPHSLFYKCDLNLVNTSNVLLPTACQQINF